MCASCPESSVRVGCLVPFPNFVQRSRGRVHIKPSYDPRLQDIHKRMTALDIAVAKAVATVKDAAGDRLLTRNPFSLCNDAVVLPRLPTDQCATVTRD